MLAFRLKRHLRWHRWINTLPRHSNTWCRSVLCIIITLANRPYSFWLLIKNIIKNSDTPHSVGLLWTRDQAAQRPLPDNTQHSRETDIHEPGGILTHNPNKREAADPNIFLVKSIQLLFKMFCPLLKIWRFHSTCGPWRCWSVWFMRYIPFVV
jgi:hypothetical protein